MENKKLTNPTQKDNEAKSTKESEIKSLRKIIRIFIGSSIEEFEEERQNLVEFIYDLRNILADKNNLWPEPKICEFEDSAMSSTRKQDDFNKLIDNSDICLFMFCLRAGSYSVEEVDYAITNYKKNQNGIPIVNVFFRNTNDRQKIDGSIKTLSTRLDDIFVNFADDRSFLGNIKLRIIHNISVLAKDLFPVSIAVEEEQNCKYNYILRLANKKILDLDETDLFETDIELREARAGYENEDDISKKNNIKKEIERLIKIRLNIL